MALCVLYILHCHAAPTVPTDHNTHTPTLNTDCHEPDDLNHMMDELRAKWPQLDKFYRFSREGFKSGDISSYLPIGSGQLYGDTSCPSKLPDTRDAELRDRSTCPWYYVINEDRTRHPQLLAEARCKCRWCVEDAGRADRGCERVTYPLPVLRRKGCTNGVYEYVEENVDVSVGCVCSKLAVKISPPQTTVDAGPPLPQSYQ